jgi:hypothetical protein
MIRNPLIGFYASGELYTIANGQVTDSQSWNPNSFVIAPVYRPWFSKQRGAVAIRLNVSQATLDGVTGTQRLVQIKASSGTTNYRTISVSYSGSLDKPFLRIERTGAGGSGTNVFTANAAMTGGAARTILAQWDSETAIIYVLEEGLAGASGAIALYPDSPEEIEITGAFPVSSSLYASPYQIAFFSGPLDAACRTALRDAATWTADMLDNVTMPYIDLTCVAAHDGGSGVVT